MFTEVKKLRLSDAFYMRDESEAEIMEQKDFEWTATMLNINYGKNRELMDKCKVLSEYSIFISKVKEYNKHMDTASAIISAVEACIKENILKDFLSKHKREVVDVCLTEFNEERYREILREDAREEGLEEGRAEGRAEKGMRIFLNLLDRGFSVEEAQATVELTDDEVKVALEARKGECTKS